jgi:GxxExxY protein
MDVFEFRERANSGVDEATEALAQLVIGAAIEVHRVLGPGFPESVYRKSLHYELELRGIACQCEVPVPVIYKGRVVGEGRIDMLVEDKLILELKVVEQLNDVHKAQCIAYLVATGLQLALLINFNVDILRKGIRRVINT